MVRGERSELWPALLIKLMSDSVPVELWSGL